MKLGGVAKLVLAAGGCAAAWSTFVERKLYTIRRASLPLLPAGSHPLRVLHVSDLHAAPWQLHKLNWVRTLRALNPDLLVLTGDLLGHRHAIEPVCLALTPLIRSTSTVFVYGSNDYYGPTLKNPFRYLQAKKHEIIRPPDLDNAKLTRLLEEAGAKNLNNRALTVTVRDSHIKFLGLNDPHIDYDDETTLQNEARKLPSTETLTVGVVHAPYAHSLNTLSEQGADLLLSGHTHGGQIRIPGYGALISNCDLPPGRARGISEWKHDGHSIPLNVSAGLGNSIYAPARFACRPEVSLITLTARMAASEQS